MVALVVAIPSDWRVPPHPLALADATRPPCRSKVAAFRCSPLRSLSADGGRSGLLPASHGEAARPAWRRNATRRSTWNRWTLGIGLVEQIRRTRCAVCSRGSGGDTHDAHWLRQDRVDRL